MNKSTDRDLGIHFGRNQAMKVKVLCKLHDQVQMFPNRAMQTEVT